VATAVATAAAVVTGVATATEPFFRA
jgi:hypothetical protein